MKDIERDGSVARSSRLPLADPALLRREMEPLHDASTNFSLLALLPAIQVAWADGAVQEGERETLLRLAREAGLGDDERAMQKVRTWLEAPPSDREVHDALSQLRRVIATGAGGEAAALPKMVRWARAVARADGGALGVGAVGREERETLRWLESALDPEGAPLSQLEGAPSRRTRLSGENASTLAILRDLLVERLECDTEHVDLVPADVESMWPRVSPRLGLRGPPAVFGVSESDYQAFMKHIVSRYVKTLMTGSQEALRVASKHSVGAVDDAELVRIAWETPMSRMLNPTLDPMDRDRFAAVLPEVSARGRPHKIDTSHLAGYHPPPGIFVEPTVALFAIGDREVTAHAIFVNGRVFRPGQGESWARARCFFLQGCGLSLVAGFHPSLHFPMDSVIAVSREVLPEAHPVARLVEAHSYLQLPLDYGVQWNERSVANNHQREIYTPYPVSGDEFFEGTATCYSGIDGNSSYPGYAYPLGPPEFPGAYCRFLSSYHHVILDFCRRVVAGVAPGDPDIAAWGAALHGFLPGFPEADALRDGETLARALAGFVHTVSVWHSAEHHAYSLEPVYKMPHRLRVPPPTGDDPPVPAEYWTRPTDIFRQEMARQMFYEAHTVRGMLQAEYGFTEPALVGAVSEFHEALRQCDRTQEKRYMELDHIACSLQF